MPTQSDRPGLRPQAGHLHSPRVSTAVPLIVPSLGGASELWVSNFVPARLWSASTASGLILGEAPAGHYFKLLEPQRGPRLWVEDPITSGRAYVEAESVGPVGPPPDSLVPPRWWGYVGVDDINVRTDPTDESTILGTLAQGLPVVVETWIEGQEVLNDQPGWAKLGEGVYHLRSTATEGPDRDAAANAVAWPARRSLDRCQPHATDGHRL